MKTLHKKYGIGRLVSFVLAFCMIFTMVPSAVFADDTTQTIYIGGNKLTVPLEEASYWKYNEADGTITQCSSDADANVLINTVGKYGTPTSSIYVNLVNVNITAKGGTEDFSNAGIYNPNPETRVYLRINGDCSVTGSKYGIYAKIDVTPCDTAAKLTITADSSLAPRGVDVSRACALYTTGANYIYRGCEHEDFSVILRSDTMTTIKGGGDFTCQSTKATMIASPNMDGSDAVEYVKENGIFNLGDMSRIKYREYKNGTLMYDKAEVTGATLKFNDGDTPVFTAKVAEEDKGKYYISSEQWSELDENGNKVKWCSSYDSENPQDEGQLLKTFEAGKTYYYSVTIVCLSWDVSFTKQTPVIINGESFTVTNKKNGEDYVVVDAQNVKRMTVPEEIKTIDVTNATLSYNAGDTPKATATLSGENAAKYKIAYEYWEEMEQQSDGSVVPVRFWYSDAAENAKLADDKKITTFEEGKTYVYSIKLETVNGNFFVSVDSGLTMTLNGEAVNAQNMTVSVEGNSVFVTALKTLKQITVQSDYKFLEGENGSWTQNSDGTLRFRANGEFSKFTEVKVDGVLVSTDNYTAQSGSTIIIFKSSYLKSLSAGTHKITVVYTDGECSANFEVKQVAEVTTSDATTAAASGTTALESQAAATAAKTPKTGDDSHPLVWIFWLVAACGGMAGCTIYGKRKH